MAPSRRTPEQRVLKVTVAATGDTVSADVKQVPEPLAGTGYATVSTSDTLARFLARTQVYQGAGRTIKQVVPRGTPILRCDQVDWDIACRFAVRGPMCRVEMTRGTMDRLDGGIRPYDGRAWSEVGSTTHVALDVYLHLAEQAGLVIEYAGGPITPSGADPAKQLIHLTATGLAAGDSVCGLSRAEIAVRGDRGVHAALAPRWMLTAEETEQFAAAHPDNANTNVCLTCQWVWNSLDTEDAD
jgi:hypothetical protein